MRLNPVIYGILVVGLFLGTIFVAQAAGFWAVSGKGSGSGEGRVQPTGTNVAEIKGWMTLGDISTAYKVSVDEILKAFNLPADTSPAKQIKELESVTFSPENLRSWLQERLSMTNSP